MTLQELQDMKKKMAPKEREEFEREFDRKWLEVLDKIQEMNND